MIRFRCPRDKRHRAKNARAAAPPPPSAVSGSPPAGTVLNCTTSGIYPLSAFGKPGAEE